MQEDKRIGIIGCGNMGEAIARGVIASNLIYGGELYLYDIDKNKCDSLKESLNANVTSSSEELVNSCNTIILAVKPQDIEGLLNGVRQQLDSSNLLLSIAAGVTIKRIKKFIEEKVRVVRVMPNMAALVKKGLSALCYDNYATPGDKDLARKIFTSLGDVVETEEAHMDAITAISGSGAAYFFYLAEQLENSAINMGIDKDRARQLSIKTALGSAALLKDSGFDAETLRKRVTSRGGTTEAAFRLFDKRKLGDILQEGIKEAARRAKEINENK